MEQKKNLPLKVRLAINEDIPFIFSSWLKNFREFGLMSKNVPNTIFYPNHHKLIQRLLKRCTAYVASNPDDPSQIYGYIVGEFISGSFVLHYIYVKSIFRRAGIGRMLFNSFDHDKSYASCCSHMTVFGEKLMFKYNMIYHPYTALLLPEELNEEYSKEKADEK